MRPGVYNPTYNGWRISESMLDSGVIFRKGRKEYRCQGSHDGEKHAPCLLSRPIHHGEAHVEYVGETYAYQSGKRYHFECAETEGFVKREAK